MNQHQRENIIRNRTQQSRLIYNLQTRELVGVAIPDRKTGANVPHTVFVTTNILNTQFGNDEEKAFYAIRGMQNEGLLPRMGSEARPLKVRDFELYKRNKQLGKRHWRWIQSQGPAVRESTGYDSVWGYGYFTENGFVIVDRNDDPCYVVAQ